MEHAPIETPERKAFYDRIDKQNMTALWTVMSALITPEPKSACVPALWRFDEIRDGDAGGGQADHRQGGRAARADAGEPRPARAIQDHHLALCRRAARHAARGGARPPPLAVGAALRAGGQGRPHLRRRRAHADVARATSSSRPYMAWHDHGNDTDEPMFWLDGLDIPLIQFLDASFVERHERGGAADRQAGGRFHARATAPTCCPSTSAARSATSPIFNYPYDRTREALHQLSRARRLRPLPRHQDALHQSRHRRPRHADHGHLHPAAAQGLQDQPLPLHRRHGVRGHGRPRPHARRRRQRSSGAPRTSSSCRAGSPSCTRRWTANACCSASPTGRCRRRSASGARTAATRKPSSRRAHFTEGQSDHPAAALLSASPTKPAPDSDPAPGRVWRTRHNSDHRAW